MRLIKTLAAAAFIMAPLASAMAQGSGAAPGPDAPSNPQQKSNPPSTAPQAPPAATPNAPTDSGSRALSPLAPSQNFDATPRDSKPADRQLPQSGK